MARARLHKHWFVKASNQVYGNKILFLLNFSIMWWKEGRAYGTYTGAKDIWGGWFFSGNHNNHKNWVPSILPHNLCLIFMRMKQFYFFLKKNKNGQLKNWDFQNRQFSLFFLEKFRDLDLVITHSKHFWPQCSSYQFFRFQIRDAKLKIYFSKSKSKQN